MDRAYSVLEIKSVDDDARVIEGIASTPSTDRMGDIVEPKGAEYKLPLPFLWQHNQKEPIGHVTRAKVTKDAINVRVEVVKTDEPGKLKDRLDEAWQSIKLGLVRGLSIGFKPLESEDIDDDSRSFFPPQRFVKWEWLELSAVTIPANLDASIQTVKAFDIAPAATGTAQNGTTGQPGVTGRVKALPLNPKPGTSMMTIAENITQYEAKRAALDARRTELMQKAAKEGTTLNPEEEEEYDNASTEIAGIDKHLVRLREQDRQNKAAAVAVAGANTEEANKARGNGKPVVPITVRPNVAKGIGFARYAMAIGLKRGNRDEAARYAEQTWPDQPEVAAYIRTDVDAIVKAAIAAGTTTDATWAGPLAVVQPLVNEFLELLRPGTLIGKMTGLRRVPFNTSVPAQTAGGTYGWVGQGAAKPLSALAFSTVTLPFAKAAGIIVITKELAKLSTPSAQEIVRNDMIEGMRQFLDTQFIDPAVAISANVSPASITNGVTGTAASGTTEAAARADLRALMNTFNTNNLGLAGVVLIMSESVAFTLGTMVNAVGQQAFPGLTAQGGTLLGIPVVTSNVVGAQIVAAHAPSILFADDGQTEIDVSEQASVQMDSVPDNPTTSTTVLVSLWQRNLIGLRADRFITWLKARANVVQRIHTVAYV